MHVTCFSATFSVRFYVCAGHYHTISCPQQMRYRGQQDWYGQQYASRRLERKLTEFSVGHLLLLRLTLLFNAFVECMYVPPLPVF